MLGENLFHINPKYGHLYYLIRSITSSKYLPIENTYSYTTF